MTINDTDRIIIIANSPSKLTKFNRYLRVFVDIEVVIKRNNTTRTEARADVTSAALKFISRLFNLISHYFYLL